MQELRLVFHRALIFALFMTIILTAGQAQATITSYSSRVNFAATVSWTLVEGWDSYTGWKTNPYTPGDIIDDGAVIKGITYNYVPDTVKPRANVDFLVAYIYRSSTGDNTLAVTGDGSQANPNYFTYDGIQFVFPSPIRAFGIDISTAATTDGTFQAKTNLGEVASSYFDTFPGYDTGQFVGFTSTEDIYSVTLALTDPDNNAHSFTLDTLRYQPVPLPPSLLLLGSGLAGLGLLRFRKHFKS